MQKCYQASSTIKSLAYSLVSIYFWFMMDKSSWVHPCTQGLFPLVADDVVYHDYCKNCFSLVVDEEWGRGHGPSILAYLSCFCWTWSWNWHVFELIVCARCLKTILLLLLNWPWCCNIYIWTQMYADYLWTLFNMWCVHAESCMILVCMWLISRSFVILDGLPDLCVLKCEIATISTAAITLVLL
jgi:hypothetical protein